MILFALIAIYPHKALVKRVYEAPSGEVTNAYLVNLLRTDPENPRLRLMLARLQMRARQYTQVLQTIAPAMASNDETLHHEAVWLSWQSEEQRYEHLPVDAPQRLKLRQSLRLQLAEIADHRWSEELLSDIARKALAFDNIPLGLRLFDRLAAESQGRSIYWYVEGARSALAHSEYRAAAEFYLIARSRETSLVEQRRYFLDALYALESGDRIAEALNVAEEELKKAPELIDDTKTLTILVRFARAARRPDLADKYARRLLRLSLLEYWRREQLAAQGFDFVVQRVAAKDETRHSGPQLPFDDKIYTLGFEAFIDNRKLEDAWKVAASAVRQAPENMIWRERLARVSEWTGRSKLGLDNWLVIARMTNRDEAWQAILRLAPGLFDDTALRAALHYQLARQPNDETLLRELVAAYERLGDPQGGLRVLEQTHHRTQQPRVLELMAELAERTGDEGLALRYWKQFIAETGLTPARAVHAATLMLVHGQPDEALALLEQAQSTATGNDLPFWRLIAEVARFGQKDSTAIGAYRRLVGLPGAEERDYDTLHLLLQDDYPLAAAQIAIEAWRRFHQPAHLVRALGHYAARERWPEMGLLLGELDAQQLRTLHRQTAFLQLSAQYFMNSGQPAIARRDLESALQIAPDAPDIQLALLWLLIDGGDGAALRRMLAANEGGWRDNPALHDALGSAYLALSLPDIALRRYYTPHLAEHRDDFLWLMNYADALEQNQDSDRAWRLRQYLLAEERQRAGRKSGPIDPGMPDAPELRRVARARLLIAQQQGDPGFAALRELLRLDRDAGGKLSPAAKDVALGWLQENAQYPAERGWLWQQYARTAARPLWAEISLALAENDRETAGQLLERHGERLPRHDRISAARLIDDVRLAQSVAFDTLTAQPADELLHQQLTDALLAHSDSIGGELTRRDAGTVGERENAARWHLAISPRLSLNMALGSIARSNRDTAVIGTTPDETYRSARLVWRHPDGESRLTAEDRKSFDNYRPLLLEHDQRIDERVSLNLALGIQQPSSESTTLRVAGKKDHAALGLRYRPTQRDQVHIEHQWDRFAAQTSTELGHGRVWQFEAAHALRLDPRDLEASVFWSGHRYSRRNDISDERLSPLLPAGTATVRDAAADFFLPDNFRYYGIRLSTDTRFGHEYTRAWRPYATVAKTWHSALGSGYDLNAGIAGSVFGADHLSFGWKLGKGGAIGGIVREIGLTYRLHY